MSEKKKPEMKKAAKNEENEQVLGEAMIDALWDQYDFLISSYRTSLNESGEAYENAMKETKKFFEEYKKMVEGFIDEQANFNKELVERFFTYQEKTLKQFDGKNEKSAKLIEQLKEIRDHYRNIAALPWKAWSKGTEQANGRIEANIKHSLAFIQKNREAWEQISDKYAKALKDSQQAWVRAAENRISPFFPAVKKAE